MTQHQRENLAKYLYDLSKILFATAVLGNLIASGPFDVITFAWGTLTTGLFLYWGYKLNG